MPADKKYLHKPESKYFIASIKNLQEILTSNNAQKDPKCLISMELSIFGYSLVSLQPGIMMQQYSKALKVATKPLNILVNFFTLLKALESEK